MDNEIRKSPHSLIKLLPHDHIVLALSLLLLHVRQRLLEHVVVSLRCRAVQVEFHIQSQLMDWRQSVYLLVDQAVLFRFLLLYCVFLWGFVISVFSF